ncbi:hypothetical protein [Thalassobaculum salexigens]|uniref:hypothetical protein n=1 Tax=Thalassobaculum salexigens TaxID=455360 RepID=UPI00248DED89|nr:hypothetical protein [Thalassobaculum salexigens]
MIIGDAIHNLRASLDLAACGAVRVARGNIKDVHFPFASSCEKIDEQIKSKKIHRAGPNIMKFIRELKPYKGGNDILRSVHDLDIIDKHISIIPTTHLASITGDVIRDGKPAFVMRSITLGSIEDGQILMRLTPVDDLEPGTEIDASFEIAFAKEHPQSSKPILPWIKEAHQTISGIIRKMENICISDKQ